MREECMWHRLWQCETSRFGASPTNTLNIPFVPRVPRYFFVCAYAGAHLCTFQESPVHPVHLSLSLFFSFDRQIRRKHLKTRTADGNPLHNRRYKRFSGGPISSVSSARLAERACICDFRSLVRFPFLTEKRHGSTPPRRKRQACTTPNKPSASRSVN